MNRHQLTAKYIPTVCVGLEVAGLHNPWPPLQSTAIQLDLITTSQLRAQYPEMADRQFVDVQILDNGNYLKSIADNSMDFLFSSHVLEHMENVIAAVVNWLRVVRPGKHVLMAIPQKNNFIDKDRTPTEFSHLWYEWQVGHIAQAITLPVHYEEYFRTVDHLAGEELKARVATALKDKPHIHFHCWEMGDIRALFLELELRLGGFQMVEFIPAGHEALVVLRKAI